MWPTIWKPGYIISDNKGLISITGLLRAKRRKLSLSEFFVETICSIITWNNTASEYKHKNISPLYVLYLNMKIIFLVVRA